YSSGILFGLAPGVQCDDTGAPSSVSESAEDIVSVRAAVPINNATNPVSTNVPITAGPTAAKKNRFTWQWPFLEKGRGYSPRATAAPAAIHARWVAGCRASQAKCPLTIAGSNGTSTTSRAIGSNRCATRWRYVDLVSCSACETTTTALSAKCSPCGEDSARSSRSKAAPSVLSSAVDVGTTNWSV